MKRLTAMEKSAIALGLLFLAVGVYTLLYPTAATVLHPGPYKYRSLLGPNPPERVSRTGARLYGGFEVLLGGAIIGLALYRGGKRE